MATPSHQQPAETEDKDQETPDQARGCTPANLAAAEREANTAQTTEPENEREEGRTDQEQQPPANARPTTRQEPKPTKKEERTSTRKNLRKDTTVLSKRR